MRWFLRLAVILAIPCLSGCVVRTGFGDDVASLFRCRQDCEKPGPYHATMAPRLSPDGELLVLPLQYKLTGETRLRGKLLLYDVRRRAWRAVALPDGIVATGVAFSPDGRRAALSVVCRTGCAPGTRGGHIALADMPFAAGTMPALKYLTHDESHVRGAPRFSPDGKRLAYAVTRIHWEGDGGFTSTFSNIAVIEADGAGEEKILSTDEFLSVGAAGFSAGGEIVFTGTAPQGNTQAMLKARLAAAGFRSSEIALEVPYILAPGGQRQPRIADGFGDLDNFHYFSCAADCSKAVFIARRDPAEKRYHYELFLADGGHIRPFTHFDQEGAPLTQASLSADGSQALVVNKGVPTLVEVASGRPTPIPAPDFAALIATP
jgi:hypothetical protein